jgi:23S rRNA G2069 N7-methylase RlmK/C1962 C5-methylase RlmI
MAGLSKDANVLDVYCYSGGFGVLAAQHGAGSVTCVDRSQAALDAAKQAAALNGVDRSISFQKGEAFEILDKLRGTMARKFDVVICDPPAFVKSRKDLKTGAQGYRKLARIAAPLVARGGSSLSPRARISSTRPCSPSRCAAGCTTPSAPAASCWAPARRSIILCIPTCPRPPT